VANYQDYLPALSRLRIPFKLGLVQNGRRDRQAEMQLNDSPTTAARWSLCSTRRGVKPAPCGDSSLRDYR
jgi:hypothetical protein